MPPHTPFLVPHVCFIGVGVTVVGFGVEYTDEVGVGINVGAGPQIDWALPGL